MTKTKEVELTPLAKLLAEDEEQWKKVDFALSMGASKEIAAGFVEMSGRSLETAINKVKNATFSEYRDQKMSKVRLKLIQKAQSMAFDGHPALLIFCLKNLCGWVDKVEHGFEKERQTIVLKYNLDDAKDVTPRVDSKN